MFFKVFLAFFIITTSNGFADYDSLKEKVGDVTDSTPKKNTIWGLVNKKYSEATLEEKNFFFGDENNSDINTVYGRLNNFSKILKEYAGQNGAIDYNNAIKLSEQIVTLLGKEDLDWGNWFTTTNDESFFGKFSELNTLLLNDFPSAIEEKINELDSTEEDLKNNLRVVKFFIHKISLFSTYSQIAELKNTIQTLNTAALKNNAEPIKALFDHFFPIYEKLVIGEWLNYINQNSEASPPLGQFAKQLPQKLIPKQLKKSSIEDYVNIFNFLGILDDENAIDEEGGEDYKNLLNSYSAPNKPDFFKQYNEFLKICCTDEAKKDFINNTLGEAGDSSVNKTIFGVINGIVADVKNPSITQMLKKQLVSCDSQYIGSDIYVSLFANIVYIKQILNNQEILTETCGLNDLIDKIGLPEDPDNSTFFGVLNELSKQMNNSDITQEAFNKADEIFDLTTPHENSLNYYVKLFKEKLIFPQIEKILPNNDKLKKDLQDVYCNLSVETIKNIINTLKNAEEDTVKTKGVYLLVGNDFKSKLIGDDSFSIKNQILRLRNCLLNYSLFDAKSLFDENFQFDLIGQIKRLSKSIDNENSESVDYRFLYENLFHGINSFQFLLYELDIKTKENFQNISDIIGYVMSLDGSMFGIVNNCIKKIKIDPLLNLIGEDETKDQTLLQKLNHTVESYRNELKFADLTILTGEKYFEESSFINTLFNILHYFYHLFENIFQVLPNEMIDKCLKEFNKQSVLFNKNLPIDSFIKDNLGFKTDKSGKTIWSSCYNILKYICEEILIFISEDDAIEDRTCLKAKFSDLLPSDLYPTFSKDIERFISFFALCRDQKIKADFVSVINNLFFIDTPTRNKSTNFDIFIKNSDNKSHEKFGLFSALDYILTTNNTELLENINNENNIFNLLRKLNYDFYIKPVFNSLTGEKPSSAKNKVSIISSIFNKIELEGLKEAKDLIGNSDSHLDLEQPTIFALFNSFIKIISESYLFLNTTNYLGIVKLIGDTYSDSTLTSSRTFFDTLNQLINILKPDKLEINTAIIKNIIGTPKEKWTDNYKSLYVILGNLFKYIVCDYANYQLSLTPTNNATNVANIIFNILNKASSAQYKTCDCFDEIIEKIGNYDAPLTNIFAEIENKKSLIIDPNLIKSYLNFGSLTNFIIKIDALNEALPKFLEDILLPHNCVGYDAEMMDKFTVIESLLDNLLIKESCSACILSAEKIRDFAKFIGNVTTNLKSLSVNESIKIFGSGFFPKLQNLISNGFSNLYNTFFIFKKTLGSCSFMGCNLMETKLEELAANLNNLIQENFPYNNLLSEINSPKDEFDSCLGLQTSMALLGEKLTEMSSFINISKNNYIEFNKVDLDAFSKIRTDLHDFIENIKNSFSIYKHSDGKFITSLSFCELCHVEDFEFSKLLNGLENFHTKIDGIEQIIRSSCCSKTVFYVSQISRQVKTSMKYFDYENINRSLTGILENNEFVQKIYNISGVLNNLIIPLTSIWKGIDDDLHTNNLFFADLENILKSCEEISEYAKDMHRIMYNDFSEQADDNIKESEYYCNVIPILINEIAHDITKIGGVWNLLESGLSKLKTLNNKRFVEAIELVGQGYTNLNEKLKQFVLPAVSCQNCDAGNISKSILNLQNSFEKFEPTINSIVSNAQQVCSSDFILSLNEFSKNLNTFSLYLTNNPTLTNDENKLRFTVLLTLGEKISIALENMDNAQLNSDCFHIVISKYLKKDMNKYVKEALKSLSDINVPPIPTSPGSIDLLNDSLENINIFLQNTEIPESDFSNCSDSSCEYFKHLQKTYSSIHNSINNISRKINEHKFCLYSQNPEQNILTETISKIAQVITTAVQVKHKLHQELNCGKFLTQQLVIISKQLKDIKITPGMNTEHINNFSLYENLKNNLCNVDGLIRSAVTFFCNSTTSKICLNDINSTTSSILIFSNEFCQNIKSFFEPLTIQYNPTQQGVIENLRNINIINIFFKSILENVSILKKNKCSQKICCTENLPEIIQTLGIIESAIFKIYYNFVYFTEPVKEQTYNDLTNEDTIRQSLMVDGKMPNEWVEIFKKNDENINCQLKILEEFYGKGDMTGFSTYIECDDEKI